MAGIVSKDWLDNSIELMGNDYRVMARELAKRALDEIRSGDGMCLAPVDDEVIEMAVNCFLNSQPDPYALWGDCRIRVRMTVPQGDE